MQEQGPRRSPEQISADLRHKSRQAAIRRDTAHERLADAAEQFDTTWHRPKIDRVARELVDATREATTADTDRQWEMAMGDVPGMTENMKDQLMAAKERIADEYRRELEITGPVKVTFEPPPPPDVETIYEEGTPKELFDARIAEAQTRYNALTSEVVDTQADQITEEFVREQKARSELGGDLLWVTALDAHPDISDTTALEVWADKDARRADYDDEFRRHRPDSEDE